MVYLVVLKLVISIAVVLGLVEVSKRIKPLLGGILSGLPLGTGLSVYFISYEQGVRFMISGIPWGIAALSSSIVFCLTYVLSIKWLRMERNIGSAVVSSLCGIASFLLIGYLLSFISLTVWSASLIFAVVFGVNLFIQSRIASERPGANRSSSHVKKMLFRGVLAGTTILFITGSAAIVGSEWSGILSSFPSTLFPVLIIVHLEEGIAAVFSVIKGFSLSVSTLVIFYYSCFWLLPLLGLPVGFLITYLICGLYVYLLSRISLKPDLRK